MKKVTTEEIVAEAVKAYELVCAGDRSAAEIIISDLVARMTKRQKIELHEAMKKLVEEAKSRAG